MQVARHDDDDDDDDDDDIFILYSLILCSFLRIVSLLYIFFPENISISSHIVVCPLFNITSIH